LQLGVTSIEAKEIVESNNIEYIENRCTKMEYQKKFLKKAQSFPVLVNR
jgi:predicted CoA-binding protein